MKNWTKEKFEKIKKLAIAIAVGGSVVAGGVAVTNVSKDTYINRFQNIATGEVVEVQTTKQEYHSLALKKAKQPIPPDGYKYIGSYANEKNP